MKKILYLGAFLNQSEHEKLLFWWKENIKIPLLENIFAHHCTLKFAPSSADLESFKDAVGQNISLEIIGFVSNQRCQAVKVKIPFVCENKHPHITIAVDNHTKPFYSNELLEQGIVECESLLLTGIIDFFPRTL